MPFSKIYEINSQNIQPRQNNDNQWRTTKEINKK
jgi:hypothetical protein